MLRNLETSRLILREIEVTDHAALSSLLCDPEVMKFSDGKLSSEQVTAWITDCLENYSRWGYGLLAIVERASGSVIGYCGLTRYENICGKCEVEIGYRLRRDRWGLGLATEAALAIKQYAQDVLHIKRLICLVHPENTASVNVAKKLGMHLENEYWGPGYSLADHVYALSEEPA